MPRDLALTWLALSLVVLGGCRQESPQVTAIDFLKRSDAAVRRPPTGDFAIVEQACAERRLASQGVPVPSRLTWTLNFPARARFAATVAVVGPSGGAAEFRIGISDRRTYETLLSTIVDVDACARGGVDLSADLSRFGGRQWSVFYRPDERRWDLIVGVTATRGEVTKAVWGLPRIETDSNAARVFLARRDE